MASDIKEKGLKEKMTAGPDKRGRSGLQRAMRGVYIIWLREFKRFWRDRPRRIGGFAQPIIYLALLGVGMQSAFKVFGGGDVSYVKFMFPGILGMTVLFTAVFSSISIIWDREFGFLKEVLVSPVPRSSVALGKIIGGSTTAMLQGMIFLVLAFTPWFYGFSLSTLWKVLAVIPILVLLALSLTSMGVAVAARMTSFEGFPIVMNFLLMPLFFLSGAFFPLQGLPGWMTVLTKIDPLTYGVDALRGIMLRGVDIGAGMQSSVAQFAVWFKDPQIYQIGMGKGYPDPAALVSATQRAALPTQTYPMWLNVSVMLGFGAVLFALALWQFNRAE
ncbi:MAG: ABC transporter permease [Actinobacteria bacterium]|nr:ABC transporter permease [Actinomycetota bacterium]